MWTSNKQSLGKDGEAHAQQFLKRLGYRILTTNYRAISGEIDIIAAENKTLVFIEVKTRRNANYGSPLEAVNLAKQEKIRRTALHYLAAQNGAYLNYRFDVIALLPVLGKEWHIEHVVNAF
mgnify:CR=1 FL=1